MVSRLLTLTSFLCNQIIIFVAFEFLLLISYAGSESENFLQIGNETFIRFEDIRGSHQALVTLQICKDFPICTDEVLSLLGTHLSEYLEESLPVQTIIKDRHDLEQKILCFMEGGGWGHSNASTVILARSFLFIDEDHIDQFIMQIFKDLREQEAWEEITKAVLYLVWHHHYKTAHAVADRIIGQAKVATPTWIIHEWARLLNYYPYRGDTSIEETVLVLEMMLAHGNHTTEAQIMLGKQLSFFYENIERYDKSFEHRLRANDLAFQEQSERLPNLQHQFIENPFCKEMLMSMDKDLHQIQHQLNPLMAQVQENNPAPFIPVFLVGPPRSGSTLYVQSLSLHSSMMSAGESTCLSWTLVGIFPNITSSLLSESLQEELSVNQIINVRKEYFSCILKNFDSNVFQTKKKSHVLDKNLLNHIHLLTIFTLFPEAKVLQMKRHPLDIAMSIWAVPFMHFCGTPKLYEYNLRKTLQYIECIDIKMDFWRRETQERKIAIASYEALIFNTTGTLQSVFDFLGLEFQDSCLSPHLNTDEPATASHWQVKRPMYKTSVGAWKKYALQIFQTFNERGYWNKLENNGSKILTEILFEMENNNDHYSNDNSFSGH